MCIAPVRGQSELGAVAGRRHRAAAGAHSPERADHDRSDGIRNRSSIGRARRAKRSAGDSAVSNSRRSYGNVRRRVCCFLPRSVCMVCPPMPSPNARRRSESGRLSVRLCPRDVGPFCGRPASSSERVFLLEPLLCCRRTLADLARLPDQSVGRAAFFCLRVPLLTITGAVAHGSAPARLARPARNRDELTYD